MIWRPGEVVELATETVMGWAARLDDWIAITKLMELKDRPLGDEKQFALALSDSAAIRQYALVDPLAAQIIADYLPGKLTLVLPKNPQFRHPYFDHYSTIGFRVPDYPPLQNVLAEAGPLLLTSANRRGELPKVTGGAPTAVWQVVGGEVVVLRPGEIDYLSCTKAKA